VHTLAPSGGDNRNSPRPKRLWSITLEPKFKLCHAHGAKPVAGYVNLTANRPPQLIHIKAPLGKAM
jgi:hypothetical protein